MLYDIGGMGPVFCHDSRHPHANPSLAFATKRQNYRALRENIKRQNPEAIIAMEHNVDIYGESMDLAQSGGSARPGKHAYPELYRYTFPELMVTNREAAEDERNYRDNIHFSLLYGLRFDMTIFRCQGELDDIPNYRDYLTKVTRMQLDYKDLLLSGRFVDNEGFTLDNAALRQGLRGRRRAGSRNLNPTGDQPLSISAAGHTFAEAATGRKIPGMPASVAADSALSSCGSKRTAANRKKGRRDRRPFSFAGPHTVTPGMVVCSNLPCALLPHSV